MFFLSPQSGGLNPCPLLARCASQSPHRRWSQDFRVTLHYGLLHSYQSCSFCLYSRRIFKTMEISAVDVYFGCKWSWPPFEAFWSVDILWRQYGTQLWPLITLHNAGSSPGSSSKKKRSIGSVLRGLVSTNRNLSAICTHRAVLSWRGAPFAFSFRGGGCLSLGQFVIVFTEASKRRPGLTTPVVIKTNCLLSKE